jgi:predicted NAD/FAD-dependent oxidoreductase
VLATAQAAGVADRWYPTGPGGDPREGDRWVGTPGMSSLPRHLAQDLDIEFGACITRLESARRGWALLDDRGSAHLDFGAVVLALPAPVAAPLAAAWTPLAARVQRVPMAPCWAVMAAFEETLERIPDNVMMSDPVLPWFARNASKPQREARETWVLHASADWSRREFERPAVLVQAALLERFSERIGRSLPRILLADSHRWRHARVEAPLGEPFLLDPESGIGFCGDWCLDARAEAGYLSGDALGAALAACRSAAHSGKMRDSR